MKEGHLAEQLQRTLRAKAAQVSTDHEPFDPAVVRLDTIPPQRRTWAAPIAAAIIVILGVTALAVAVRRDSGPGVSAQTPSTTTTTLHLDLRVRALEGWPDIPDAATDGSVPVRQFNDALDASHPAWETSATAVALAYTHFPDDLVLEHGTVTAEQEIDAAGRIHLALTHRGLGDDSIAAERYLLVMSQQTDGNWRLESAQWSQQCQPNRGHRTFTKEACA